MRELQLTKEEQELEEIIKVENDDILISARDLHEFVKSNERFSKWWERMTKYGFENGIDYTPYKKVHPQNKQKLDDYLLKVDAAKEVSMIQRNDRGKLARQYFIKREKQYWEQLEENKRLSQDNTELHKIAISDDEQKERQYQADKTRYSWKNIRTVLEQCDYKNIEDEVSKTITFHTEDLKKRDRANYDSHRDANNTEYKQIVRDRVFEVLDDITNTTLDGVLRAVTSELRVNVIKDKLSTTNRSTSRIQSNLEREIEASREPTIDEYHMLNIHALSENSMYESVNSYKGEAYTAKTDVFKRWEDDFPHFNMPISKELGVDTTKEMSIYLAYDHLDKFDVANLHKAVIDRIAKHYNFDDVLIKEVRHKSNRIVSSYDKGKVYFILQNLDEMEYVA